MGIATCPSALIVILGRGSHSAATQLRVNPLCGPSFLRSASGAWGDFLGANSCAPIASHSPWGCMYLSLVSCTWFSPDHGPLMGRICPRVSQQWRGYFTSQVYPLLVLELMALKPPFFVTVLSYQGPRLPHGVTPSTVFPTRGHRGVTPSISPLGYVFSWRHLLLATVPLGRCLCLAMPLLGDASLGRCLSWAMPHMSDHLIFHYITRR